MTEEKEKPVFEFQYPSEVENWLGVKDIREYPGGPRAAIREILLNKLPAGNWDSREIQHLLQAVKTDGFKTIPASLFRSTHNVMDVRPDQLLFDVSQQLKWQRDIIGWLLNELEGKNPPLHSKDA